ncbi:STAS domain-containing protein [Streptomyces sp. 8K308]|uniref:STAS domain-containing protein n=1 Tax=Streptomyces sp. 8K308 TaxID=2530388 RepID=UPI00140464DC|nr:STAS domain-containing protein [Streptomyces sp. 8K308]
MTFEAYLGFSGDSASLHLSGELRDIDVPVLRSLLDQALARDIDQLTVEAERLTAIAAGGVRCLAFALQRLPKHARLLIAGASPRVREMLARGGVEETVTLVEARVGGTG